MKDQIPNITDGVLAPCQAALVVHRQDTHLVVFDHPCQFLKPFAIGPGSGYGLVPNDNDIATEIDPANREGLSNLPFLIVATLGSLHVTGEPRVDHDTSLTHNAPRKRGAEPGSVGLTQCVNPTDRT